MNEPATTTRTIETFERYGQYVMTEIVEQVGGMDGIADIETTDVMDSNAVTVADLSQYDQIVIVGIKAATATTGAE